MQKVHVYKRLTNKYNDGWRHLDSSVYIGTVVLTAPKCIREGTGHDEGGVFTQLATLPASLSGRQRKEFRAALAENLSKWGCRHEYDCCGCELRSTRVLPTEHARKALVVTRVSYNY